MLIDTNDIINSSSIFVKVGYKNGTVKEILIHSDELKFIEFVIKEKDYRESIWGDSNEKRKKKN